MRNPATPFEHSVTRHHSHRHRQRSEQALARAREAEQRAAEAEALLERRTALMRAERERERAELAREHVAIAAERAAIAAERRALVAYLEGPDSERALVNIAQRLLGEEMRRAADGKTLCRHCGGLGGKALYHPLRDRLRRLREACGGGPVRADGWPVDQDTRLRAQEAKDRAERQAEIDAKREEIARRQRSTWL